jgi:hypothetical protein
MLADWYHDPECRCGILPGGAPAPAQIGVPARVRLLSQQIDVVLTENPTIVHAHDNEGEPLEQEVTGSWNPDQSRITLDTTMGFERTREVFLHENIHAMLRFAQVDKMCEGARLSEEAVVSALAPVMLAWLRDNPQAVRYVTEVQS